ncbi:MAG: hypothetical protein ACRERD_09860 [Candidatus Binatia bacterium]
MGKYDALVRCPPEDNLDDFVAFVKQCVRSDFPKGDYRVEPANGKKVRLCCDDGEESDGELPLYSRLYEGMRRNGYSYVGNMYQTGEALYVKTPEGATTASRHPFWTWLYNWWCRESAVP